MFGFVHRGEPKRSINSWITLLKYGSYLISCDSWREWKVDTRITLKIPISSVLSIHLVSHKSHLLLLNRIHNKLDAKAQVNQVGYRFGWGCAEHIHVLRKIQKGHSFKNLLLVAVVVDFKKVFQSIYRSVILRILRHYGIPKQITNAICLL